MLQVRKINEDDVPRIRDLFMASYGEEYPYKEFYDVRYLKKMCFNDNILTLVCVNEETTQIVGSASVVMDIGAYTDLTGEFGRLTVHPEFRNRGIAKLLMEKRIEYINERLHVGIVEARAVHPFAQKISDNFSFTVCGFLPQKHLLNNVRESVVHLVQYFGNALQLRRKNPHIIPEIAPLAQMVMDSLSLEFDAQIDENMAPYPYNNSFEIENLSSKGYTHLLRIQRGRTKNREVFGPLRLHYGFFKLAANDAEYLLAMSNKNIIGAIGFVVDKTEKTAKIFELIAIDDACIRFLFLQVQKNLEQFSIEYIEVDISAYAPRIQRTLLELGYTAVSYIPAFAFHDTERVDIVRMIRLEIPCNIGKIKLIPSVQKLAGIVLKDLYKKRIFTCMNKEMYQLPIFSNLSESQLQNIAMITSIKNYPQNHTLYKEGDELSTLIVILQGEVEIVKQGKKIGTVYANECLGEVAFITSNPHFATATARTEIEILVIKKQDLKELIRMRPDIAVKIHRNLAQSVGEKLKRVNKTAPEQLKPKSV